MAKVHETEINIGDVVFSKADEDFKLPMVVTHLPSRMDEAVHCTWIGSQKNQVRGSFPIEALAKKTVK